MPRRTGPARTIPVARIMEPAKPAPMGKGRRAQTRDKPVAQPEQTTTTTRVGQSAAQTRRAVKVMPRKAALQAQMVRPKEIKVVKLVVARATRAALKPVETRVVGRLALQAAIKLAVKAIKVVKLAVDSLEASRAVDKRALLVADKPVRLMLEVRRVLLAAVRPVADNLLVRAIKLVVRSAELPVDRMVQVRAPRPVDSLVAVNPARARTIPIKGEL